MAVWAELPLNATGLAGLVWTEISEYGVGLAMAWVKVKRNQPHSQEAQLLRNSATHYKTWWNKCKQPVSELESCGMYQEIKGGKRGINIPKVVNNIYYYTYVDKIFKERGAGWRVGGAFTKVYT